MRSVFRKSKPADGAAAPTGRPRADTIGWKEGDEVRYERDEKGGMWVTAVCGRRFPIQQEQGFLRLRELADRTEGWTRKYAKNHVYAWDMPSQDKGESTVNVVRVWACFDVPPYVMYDVIHDASYRSQWDQSMMEGYNICRLDRTNDIGYYACRFPAPLKNRDFCNERSWRNFNGHEFIIMNSSQPHPDCPEKKGFIRARSVMTGYIIRPWGAGCCITYISQSEPRGWIPTKVMNSVMTSVAPGIMEKLRKAAAGYVQWKSQNDPAARGWMSPPEPWTRDPGPGLLLHVAELEGVSLAALQRQQGEPHAWDSAPYGGQPRSRPAPPPPPAADAAAAPAPAPPATEAERPPAAASGEGADEGAGEGADEGAAPESAAAEGAAEPGA